MARLTLLIFHSQDPSAARDWDPTRQYILDHYRQLLNERTIEFSAPIEPTLSHGELARQPGFENRNGVVLVDNAGRVLWSRASLPGESLHPDVMLEALERGEAHENGTSSPSPWTRREFLATASIAAVVVMLPPMAHAALARAGISHDVPGTIGPDGAAIQLNVNGITRNLRLEPRVTLLDTLRERLNLTGTKKGCDHGQCGACTVLVDGVRVNSCLTLAVASQGKKITTIEGLAQGDTLHPMQAAFLECDGFQCGYCTPGQIMSAVVIDSPHEPCGPKDADVRECMAGNICRCGAYDNIVSAVQKGRGRTRDAGVNV